METVKKNQLGKLREHHKRMGGLHHAYLFDHSTEETHAELLEFLESDLGMATSGNPDFWCVAYESFGIDNARELGERASRIALGVRKVFVIETCFITVQAQNALLKVLEEPSSTTHFFILMPNADILLPTVASRLMRIEIGHGSSSREVIDERVRSFLAQDTAKRIAFLKTAFLKTPQQLKDKKAAILFINALEKDIYSRSVSGIISVKIAESLKEIELCRKYMYDTSVSMKILLEHLALTLPKYE